jgi:hypothetical protein
MSAVRAISSAGLDYTFLVPVPETTAPFGPVSKENYDLTEINIDYTNWLEPGETISFSMPPVAVAATPQVPWQQDYPLDAAISACAGTVTDTYPLTVISTSVESTIAQALLQAGTPGLTYAVSFVATASISERRKQVDVLVFVGSLVNPLAVGAAGPTNFGVSSVTAGEGLIGGGTGAVGLALHVPVSIADGGTGAVTAPQALANLGGAPIGSIPSVSGLAPLASPAFTGVPTAPTAATGTNTTQLATTAFVDIAACTGVVVVTSASYTLSIPSIGRIFVNFNGAVTITLAPGVMLNGQEIVIADIGGACSTTNSITVLPGSGSSINGQPSAIINTAYGRLRLLFWGNYVVS